MSKRSVLAAALCRSGTAALARGVGRWLWPSLVIYAYHRILPESADYPFDAELISATPEEFEAQVKWLARSANPVTFRDLARIEREGGKLPTRPVMITFDDGFEDNYSQAFPILRKHGVPATFYVSSGYIGTDRVFWFDWLAHRVMNPGFEHLQLKSLDLDCPLPAQRVDRARLCYQVLERVKRAPWSEQEAVIEELLADQTCAPKGHRKDLSRTMSWDALREMSDAGMEIGSHGVEHLMLAKLSDTRLQAELEQSRARIESEIGQPVVSVAYPVGGEDACDERVFAAARQAGYDYAVVYQRGRNPLAAVGSMRHRLQRFAVERHVTPSEFACATSLPWLY